MLPCVLLGTFQITEKEFVCVAQVAKYVKTRHNSLSFAQEAMNQMLHKHYATLAMLANFHIMGHHVKPVIQEATVLKEMKNVLSALLDTNAPTKLLVQ